MNYLYRILIMLVMTFLLTSIASLSKAQIVSGQNALDADIGKSDLGYIVHAGYLHFFSSNLSVKGALFYESASPYQLNYQNQGIEALARYRIVDLKDIFFLTPYGGLCLNYDKLSPVKKEYRTSLNYGFKAGVEVEAVLSDNFSFVGYFSQIDLMKKHLGNLRYDYGIGIRFYLGN